MGIQELRKEVQKYIDEADEQFLQMVFAMKNDYKIGQTPFSKEDLIKRAKDASSRVKSGYFIAHEDLEKEIKNW